MKLCCEENQSCIARVPIFKELSATEMAEIAAITRHQSYAKGERIYQVGERLESLFVVHSGSVKIYRTTYDGKEQVIRTVSQNGFFGELSLFSHQEAVDSADALQECMMCILEGEAIKTLMKRFPSIAFKVLEEVSRRLEKSERSLEQANLYSAEQRLAHYLLEITGGSDYGLLAMSKGDVASHLGMSAETLSRKLKLFQEQNFITLEGQRKIIITARKALEEVAQEGYQWFPWHPLSQHGSLLWTSLSTVSGSDSPQGG